MYNNVLVPLDGSQLAECTLPHVQAIADGCEVRNVTFLRVVEPFYIPSAGEGYNVTEEDVKKFEADLLAEAKDYLSKLVSRLSYKTEVKTEVIKGKVAETIAKYATEHGADLIIIATHGRSGVSRWVWGSVADRILRSACVPVFMVRAPGCVPGI